MHFASETPIDADGLNDGTIGGSIAATLDLRKDGVAVFMNFHNNDAGTYSSAADATTPVSVEGGSITQPGHLLLTADATGHVETVMWAGANRARSMAGASWR